MKKFIYWLPRILSLLLIGFLTLFSFDVFGGAEPWYIQIAAFAIHSIPSLVLVAVTVLAWKKPKIGGWVFVAFGAALLVLTRFNPAALVVSLPPVAIGLLYFRGGPKTRNDKI